MVCDPTDNPENLLPEEPLYINNKIIRYRVIYCAKWYRYIAIYCVELIHGWNVLPSRLQWNAPIVSAVRINLAVSPVLTTAAWTTIK